MTARTLEEIESEIAKLGVQKWYGAAHTLRLLAIAQEQRGVMAADEERTKTAAVRVWGEHVRGCDTVGAMADLITGLRVEIARLKRAIIELRDGVSCYGWENAPDIEYLGHARDLIKIADDAHEPTGAGLVGKLCEYRDIDSDWDHWDTGVCKSFAPGADQPYLRDQGGQFRFARLAR